MIKRFLIIGLSMAAFLLMTHFILHFDGHFREGTFSHGFKKSYATEVNGLDPQTLDPILYQPFSYLGHGKQMTAFLSADGRYVLKFFNPMRPLKENWISKPKLWSHYCSLKWISREWFGKSKRLQKLFNRHKLAFEELQNETGLIYVHLSPSEKINHMIHLLDQEGHLHIIPLANTPFVIQQKADLAADRLNSLIQNGQDEKAKELIAALQKLIHTRIEKGIADRLADHHYTLNYNYGFIGDTPIQIDVGRIRLNEKLAQDPKSELAQIDDSLKVWVQDYFPSLK